MKEQAIENIRERIVSFIDDLLLNNPKISKMTQKNKFSNEAIA